MGSFVVNGGNPLSGRVVVSGAKNSALPILFSTISAKGISKIHNVPDIGDVKIALDILRGFGAEVKIDADTVTIDTRELHYYEPPETLTASLRASTYLIGATLAPWHRYGGQWDVGQSCTHHIGQYLPCQSEQVWRLLDM